MNNQNDITIYNLYDYLNLSDKFKIEELYDNAQKTKWKYVGNNVYLRGLIELSNICIKDCYYCGIRNSNTQTRFTLSIDDVLKSVKFAYENNYYSIVIQAGERCDEEFIDHIELLLKKIHVLSNRELMITLSLGEQTEDTYKRWFLAGAHRYLLRIETSNEKLFSKIHPYGYSFSKRCDCLKILNKIGYQTGTGVMIGLPDQTTEDLVNDIIFFKNYDIDMIGMGPYIPHKSTPLGKNVELKKEFINYQVNLTLKMIATTRLYLKNVNIASTTALQTLNSDGLVKGIMAGANVIMPNVTSEQYKIKYNLYEGKSSCNDTLLKILEEKLNKIGENIGYSNWGSSMHFLKKENNFTTVRIEQ
ncbi:MAG: [FeFe] hydrogenase H-cluster radical SAM maturase HydE [bacterium]|nr:[FeFe] hydrogenase H-cluster radical SAM maturase HydE [bacterium]